MAHRSRLILILLALAAILATAGMPSARAEEEDLPPGQFVARLYYTDPASVSQLGRYDVWEHNRQEGYLVVAMDGFTYRYLEELGFTLVVDEELTAELNQPRVALPGQTAGIPGYPCYRTVEETYATAQELVTNYPMLATWSDIGDSWQKTQGSGGHDLQVLRLTNVAVGDEKPKLFITAAIHAREYATAELVTRFAEELVAEYGIDPDVTWLLDHHEIHLMLQTNPDGRKVAEAGDSWRKNINDNYCPSTALHPPYGRGADLNRNFEFQWGCCGGSSATQCDPTYRGPSAASELETQAVQAYLQAQFPDQRLDDLSAAAPVDATGVYLDIHSYGDLVLWPWGFTSAPSPNGTALQTLGRKFAYFNGYEPDQAYGFYPTDGTTDDYGYGQLGVASYAFEVGTAFFQDCGTFENTIVPENLPALRYAAKVARTPYLTPAGPDSISVAVSADGVVPGTLVQVTATIDDTRYNPMNGAEPVQNVVAAEVYVDVPPWDTASGPIAHPMAPVDGAFDSPVEEVTGAVDTAGLDTGRHILFVRGQDGDGNWGAFSAAFLTIEEEPCQAPTAVDDLAIFATGSNVELSWSAVAGADHYQVWRAENDPFFAPPLDAQCTESAGCIPVAGPDYVDSVLGDPANDHTYLVRPVAACGAVAAAAGRVGEFEFGLFLGE
jgi:carboxypeptidase T